MSSLKEIVRSVAPKTAVTAMKKTAEGIGTALAAQPWIHEMRLAVRPRRVMFNDIYASKDWGSEESGSGTGSELRATEDIRVRLPELLSAFGIHSLLDAPCGDWNWMQHVNLPVAKYTGVDIVPSVVEQNRRRFSRRGVNFAVADLTGDDLPKAECILCRDCLVHLSYADISAVLKNFKRSGATYLLVNTYPQSQINRDQFTGAKFRLLNMSLPPFDFPPPLELFPDGGDVDPSMIGLWKLQELPALAP